MQQCIILRHDICIWRLLQQRDKKFGEKIFTGEDKRNLTHPQIILDHAVLLESQQKMLLDH